MHAFAFLRGINVGGRRPKKDELVAAADGPELHHVSTFLASGNLLFETATEPTALAATLEARLGERLGYDVACFVRTLDELRSIVDTLPVLGADEKHQVAFFQDTVDERTRAAYAAAAGETDVLRWRDRELVWTHVGGMLDSPIGNAMPKLTPPTNTVRTGNTVERLVAKFA
ncbi:DUF1697 domain-containing protein [Actinospongicola halichondriae]|uniref:DUF1697 domain-containing protein n=1 Tax=Actinospongicola halichondriae TaxID=3236844 RepID=UPI003D557896